MSKIIKSIGHGLLAAGVLLIVVLFIGVYLRGAEAFRDAFDPLAANIYLALLALTPGVFLLWLGDRLSSWRLYWDRTKTKAHSTARGLPVQPTGEPR
jgi:hypothetical protein